MLSSWRGIVPLVERLGGVDALVALQAHERRVEHRGERLGRLGLADARLALEQQRLRQAHAEEERRGEALVDEVVDVGEPAGERLDVRREHAHLVRRRAGDLARAHARLAAEARTAS